MLNQERKTLAIVGAGPKGLAVAVKAKVLEEMGLPVHRVILIEKQGVGAHWTGEAGFTNGEMKLGTSPEKDLVFPLETKVNDIALERKIRSRLRDFTWASFLMEEERYADWVDRGRPAPCHKLWARYLNWVGHQLYPEVTIIKGEVQEIDLDGEGNFELRIGDEFLKAHQLMLTGPGKARLPFGAENIPSGRFDLESFWKALKDGNFKTEGRLAIVGAGENSASVLLALKNFSGLEIEVISPRGFISTRAENYHENQFYSGPDRKGWKKLTPADRQEFIHRTDLGVFSVDAMSILNGERNHTIVPGRLIKLEEREGLELTLEYAGTTSRHRYDQVVLATGFDQLGLMKSLFTPKLLGAMEDELKLPLTSEALAERIGEDLSVNGLSFKLHLPMLAGLAQGPGFANLSCLGLLADRVLLGGQA